MEYMYEPSATTYQSVKKALDHDIQCYPGRNKLRHRLGEETYIWNNGNVSVIAAADLIYNQCSRHRDAEMRTHERITALQSQLSFIPAPFPPRRMEITALDTTTYTSKLPPVGYPLAFCTSSCMAMFYFDLVAIPTALNIRSGHYEATSGWSIYYMNRGTQDDSIRHTSDITGNQRLFTQPPGMPKLTNGYSDTQYDLLQGVVYNGKRQRNNSFLLAFHSYALKNFSQLAILEPAIIICDAQASTRYIPCPLSGDDTLAVVGHFVIQDDDTIKWRIAPSVFKSKENFNVGKPKYDTSGAVVDALRWMNQSGGATGLPTGNRGCMSKLKKQLYSEDRRGPTVVVIQRQVMASANENVRNLLKNIKAAGLAEKSFVTHLNVTHIGESLLSYKPEVTGRIAQNADQVYSLPLCSGEAIVGGPHLQLARPPPCPESSALGNYIKISRKAPICILSDAIVVGNCKPRVKVNATFIIVSEKTDLNQVSTANAILQQGPQSRILVFMQQTNQLVYWGGCDPNFSTRDVINNISVFADDHLDRVMRLVPTLSVSTCTDLCFTDHRGATAFTTDGFEANNILDKFTEYGQTIRGTIDKVHYAKTIGRQMAAVLVATDMTRLQDMIVKRIVEKCNPSEIMPWAYVSTSIDKWNCSDQYSDEVTRLARAAVALMAENTDCVYLRSTFVTQMVMSCMADSTIGPDIRKDMCRLIRVLVKHIEHDRTGQQNPCLKGLYDELKNVICSRECYGVLNQDIDRAVHHKTVEKNVAMVNNLSEGGVDDMMAAFGEDEDTTFYDVRSDTLDSLAEPSGGRHHALWHMDSIDDPKQYLCLSCREKESTQGLAMVEQCQSCVSNAYAIRLHIRNGDRRNYEAEYAYKFMSTMVMTNSLAAGLIPNDNISLHIKNNWGVFNNMKHMVMIAGNNTSNGIFASIESLMSHDFRQVTVGGPIMIFRMLLRKSVFDLLSSEFKNKHAIINPGNAIVGHAAVRMLLNMLWSVPFSPDAKSSLTKTARTLMHYVFSILCSGADASFTSCYNLLFTPNARVSNKWDDFAYCHQIIKLWPKVHCAGSERVIPAICQANCRQRMMQLIAPRVSPVCEARGYKLLPGGEITKMVIVSPRLLKQETYAAVTENVRQDVMDFTGLSVPASRTASVPEAMVILEKWIEKRATAEAAGPGVEIGEGGAVSELLTHEKLTETATLILDCVCESGAVEISELSPRALARVVGAPITTLTKLHPECVNVMQAWPLQNKVVLVDAVLDAHCTLWINSFLGSEKTNKMQSASDKPRPPYDASQLTYSEVISKFAEQLTLHQASDDQYPYTGQHGTSPMAQHNDRPTAVFRNIMGYQHIDADTILEKLQNGFRDGSVGNYLCKAMDRGRLHRAPVGKIWKIHQSNCSPDYSFATNRLKAKQLFDTFTRRWRSYVDTDTTAYPTPRGQKSIAKNKRPYYGVALSAKVLCAPTAMDSSNSASTEIITDEILARLNTHCFHMLCHYAKRCSPFGWFKDVRGIFGNTVATSLACMLIQILPTTCPCMPVGMVMDAVMELPVRDSSRPYQHSLSTDEKHLNKPFVAIDEWVGNGFNAPTSSGSPSEASTGGDWKQSLVSDCITNIPEFWRLLPLFPMESLLSVKE